MGDLKSEIKRLKGIKRSVIETSDFLKKEGGQLTEESNLLQA